MLRRLFSREWQYLAGFEDIAKQVVGAARLLQQGFEEPARWPELSVGIHSVVRRVDDDSHGLDAGLDRKYFLPVDREDPHHLSARIRRVADIIAGVARRAVSFRANERREHAIRLARTLLEATQEIEQAITHIRDAGAVLERSRAIKAREERGDELYAEAVTELFAGYPNPIDVLRWKAIYDELEEALNASDDVANALETITVKHG
jgi:uncharacterized protein Yka (UPF0111/DUF47 family)